jgi:hypothetical protein
MIAESAEIKSALRQILLDTLYAVLSCGFPICCLGKSAHATKTHSDVDEEQTVYNYISQELKWRLADEEGR